jgi:cellulose synthase/poly-beta-1,6-N-acetylglucosamine synthase-like glycosyltransferase
VGTVVSPPNREHDWAVGVVIPARNEEGSIAACLQSVLTALDQQGLPAQDRWVVVVADSCNDGTADVARRTLKNQGVALECSLSSAGAARRLGAAQVLARFEKAPFARVWIANTDADSCVAPDWIAQQLSLAERGYCGVAGIVHVDNVHGLEQDELRALLADYTIHDNGTHPHVHGANLGVRADAYVDAGCWMPIALAEDHCLWSRIKARGWPTASCAKTIVRTSGRLHGRAAGGFADSLRHRLQLLHPESFPCTP